MNYPNVGQRPPMQKPALTTRQPVPAHAVRAALLERLLATKKP